LCQQTMVPQFYAESYAAAAAMPIEVIDSDLFCT
jgi:hypothetical protein